MARATSRARTRRKGRKIGPRSKNSARGIRWNRSILRFPPDRVPAETGPLCRLASNALSSRFRPICGLSSIEDFNSAIQGSPVHRYDSVPHVQTGGGPFTRSRRNAVHAETRARYASAWPPTRDGGEVLYVARGGSTPNFVGIGIKVIREAFVSSCN